MTATDDLPADLLGEPFRVASITEVPAPEGSDGVWCRYVIVQGTNRIDGFRAGTRSEVAPQVDAIVGQLNQRFRKGGAGGGGYGRSKAVAPAASSSKGQPN